jgi:hypothetical protein
MRSTPGQRNIKKYYWFIGWLYPIGRLIYPAGFCTLQEVAEAMITVVRDGYPKNILEVKDIVAAASASHRGDEHV